MKTIIVSLLCVILVAGSGGSGIGEGKEKTVIPNPEPLSPPGESILANTWTNMNPSTHPGARSHHAMAYDSQSDRVILFGGYSGRKYYYYSDTWAYDLSDYPFVMGTTPANNSVDVPLNTNIIITFSEVMNKTATEGAISASPSISWSASWSSWDTVITLTPSANLEPSTKYTITITTDARSAEGANLAGEYKFSFTTGRSADTTPPAVVSTSPKDGDRMCPPMSGSR
jgi:hypothetical protein